MELLPTFIVFYLLFIVTLYLIEGERIDLKNPRLYIVYIISLILLYLNLKFIPIAYNIITNCIIYILLPFFLFKCSLKESVVLGIIIMLVSIISEILCVIITSPIISQDIFLNEEPVIVFFQNLIIGLIMCFCGFAMKRKKVYLIIMNRISQIGSKQVVIFSLVLVLMFNFFMWIAYFAFVDLFNNLVLSYVGSIISIFSVILVYSYLSANSKYSEVMEKYSVSLDNIKLYEDIIENNRVNNHEVRNQFLMLRGMSKNKKLNTYIDSILDKNISTNEDLLNKVIKIPSGGLRGLIYTKLIQMQDNNINYEVHVDKRVNSRKFNKIDSNTMIDICKIIGVFIDNAIECVFNLKKKNITIEFYVERNNIIVCITNNFEGKIDFDKLGTGDYTTKGNGHGYGLKLVKEILSRNYRLENSCELYEDNFTQNLKIKM